jgi:hypothetical protein
MFFKTNFQDKNYFWKNSGIFFRCSLNYFQSQLQFMYTALRTKSDTENIKVARSQINGPIFIEEQMNKKLIIQTEQFILQDILSKFERSEKF